MADWKSVATRIRVPLTFVYAVLYLLFSQPTWRSILAGSGLIVAGLALRAVASGHVTKAAELTTSGPYAYTRNPLYLGSMILGAGFAIAARNWWLALLMAAVLLLVYLPVIRREEEYLRARHPEYEAYAQRVPRLLPRLRAAEAWWAFSRERYLRHREYNALLGSVAVMAALALKLLFRSRLP